MPTTAQQSTAERAENLKTLQRSSESESFLTAQASLCVLHATDVSHSHLSQSGVLLSSTLRPPAPRRAAPRRDSAHINICVDRNAQLTCALRRVGTPEITCKRTPEKA